MKKVFYFVACLLIFACKGFELQPDFISVFGADEQTITLDKYEQLPDNSVLLYFSTEVDLENETVLVGDENDAKEILCLIEKSIVDGKAVNHIKFENEIPIGFPYVISGTVKSGNSLQEFSLNFKGVNSNPAKLFLNEYKPMGTTKKVLTPEFIELIVTEAGNLSDFKLCSVGSKKNLDYVFPACDVEKGEIIVVHLYADHIAYPEIYTKNAVDEIGSSTADGIKTARDFYAKFGKPSRRKTNVVLLENHEGLIIDYLTHILNKSVEDGNINWDDDIKDYVNKLLKSPFREKFENEIQNPKTVNLTSIYSFAKKGDVWIKTKDITCGQINANITEAK